MCDGLYSASMSLDIHIECSFYLTQLVCHWTSILGAVLTLLSRDVAEHTHWVWSKPYSAGICCWTYTLGAVLTLLSFYVTGYTHWVQFLPYSAGMSLDIHIGCSTNLTQPRCRWTYTLGVVLTLLSWYMLLNIHIGCSPNLAQLVYVAGHTNWVQY